MGTAKKMKVGILTFSDGRDYIHEDLLQVNWKYQNELKEALEKTGKVEVIAGQQIIGSNLQAKQEAIRLKESGVEVTIFNYAIWCYPNFTAIASTFLTGPFLLFCNLHPSECGMVGMLAAAGTLDQLDIRYRRIWGSIREDDVLSKVMSFLTAACAVGRLKGQTFGNFGGRPLGMYTAVSNLEQWQKEFGIDVESIEQEDIVRYGAKIPDEKVDRALAWLESHVGDIRYDSEGLTPDKLKLQIRSYYGLRAIIDKKNLDFIGIKAHGDLTENYATMDIAEAFLNDPYDWDGPHEPIVAATEADMDGALTMQLFKLITGAPVLFADVRHYDKDDNVWYFSNSGTHATFFAGASYDPAVNLAKVTFYPEKNYYPAGGASVHHFAAPGQVTLARLSRKNGKYRMAIVPAEFVEFPREIALAKGATTTPEWPIAFTRLQVSADYFLENFPCNHIHGVYGDCVDELTEVAHILDMEVTLFAE
ncbi:MAG: L-fucose/L-arabinose isomerase family protein [Saccharofermentanales bacterium]